MLKKIHFGIAITQLLLAFIAVLALAGVFPSGDGQIAALVAASALLAGASTVLSRSK